MMRIGQLYVDVRCGTERTVSTDAKECKLHEKLTIIRQMTKGPGD